MATRELFATASRSASVRWAVSSVTSRSDSGLPASSSFASVFWPSIVTTELRGSVGNAANIELMQMAVGPAEGRQEHLVELGKAERDWQFESAADLGLDADDKNLDAHNEAV